MANLHDFYPKKKGTGSVSRHGHFLKLATVAVAGALTLSIAPLAVGQDDAANAAVEAAIAQATAANADSTGEAAPEETPESQADGESAASGDAETTGEVEASSEPSISESASVEADKELPVKEDTLEVEQLSESTFKLTLDTRALSGEEEASVPVVTLQRDNADQDIVAPRRVEFQTAKEAEEAKEAAESEEAASNEQDKKEPTYVSTAFASATEERPTDLLSFDMGDLKAEEGDKVSFVYVVNKEGLDADAEKDGWAFAERGSQTAFEVGRTLSAIQPRSAMLRAASTQKRPYMPSQLGKIETFGPYPGGDTGMNNIPYYGPLEDPDFGQEFEQNPSSYIYKKSKSGGELTYPIRHRNWSAREYYTTANRPLRGPKVPGGGSGGGNDTLTYWEQEQGLFFSRDHVQYAWSQGSAVYRGDEFLLGGGADDGVWYGGMYSLPQNTSLDWSANYRQTNQPGFKLYIDDRLNTDDPGWIKKRETVNGLVGYSYISPDGSLMIRFDQRAGSKSFDIKFLDLQKMKNDGVFNESTGRMPASFNMRAYRAGISTPGWTRVFIGAGATDSAKAIKPVNSMNGYLYSQFVPEFGRTSNPKVTKKVIPASAQTPWGEEEIVDPRTNQKTMTKYIDYQIDVTTPVNGKGKYFYKFHETPDFGPGIRIIDAKLTKASGNSLEDFKLKKILDDAAKPEFEIVNSRKRQIPSHPELGNSDYLEIWNNQTHSVTLRMYFDPETDEAFGTSDECKAGNGLYNKVTLTITGQKSPPDADACAKYYQPEITKKLKPVSAEQAWGKTATGQYYVDYDISVRTPATPRHAYFYKLTEQPNFGPNITVNDLQITAVDGKAKEEFKVNRLDNSSGNPTFEIVNRDTRTVSYASHLGAQNYLEIWENQTHTITVRVHFTPSSPAQTGTGKCGPGNGLYNKVTMKVADLPSTFMDDECASFNPIVLATAGVIKMDENGNYLPLGNDFEFEIRDESGNVIPFSRQATLSDGRSNFVLKGTQPSVLEMGRLYYLVESRAPKGYELLAQPVGFRVVERNGSAEIQLENPAAHPQINKASLGNFSLGPNSVYFAVSDMRQGTLPESGGPGVWWMLGGGMVLLLAAAAASRRFA